MTWSDFAKNVTPISSALVLVLLVFHLWIQKPAEVKVDTSGLQAALEKHKETIAQATQRLGTEPSKPSPTAPPDKWIKSPAVRIDRAYQQAYTEELESQQTSYEELLERARKALRAVTTRDVPTPPKAGPKKDP